jgi:carboxypeptidase family protein
MRTSFTSLLGCVALLCALAAGPAAGQTITTGTISGTVTDAQGGVLPGATVTAVHTPTGTTYEAVTEADGHFLMLNVRAGGPYTIAVNMSGFRDEKLGDIQVALGEEKRVSFTMQLASLTETVEVTGQASPIDTSRAGAGGNIAADVKETLPTITRSIADIVRINPLFNAQGGGAGDQASVVSAAGTSYRYNSLQIDGAQNQDLFGLASSAGAPGGTAETQPISLDAIQEIQLVVSPYDVRQGGFAGGGINAITKSGTNEFHGTAFFFGRNQDWVGKGIDNRKVSTFKDKQGGGSIGGPIVQNRAFFFGTADYGRKSRPTGLSVSSSGQQFGQEALVDQFLGILQSRYGYTPGPDPKGEFTRATNNDKYFVRTDLNLASGHQMTVRHNYITGYNDIGTPSQTLFKMPDNYYRYVSDTNSTVAQLNSMFGAGVNEFRVTYTRVRDHRETPFDQPGFPQVRVTLAPSKDVVAGREQFSTRNAIDQDIVEVNEAFTMAKGKHTITIGSHNEFLKLRNLFIRDNFGTYSFSSLANFQAGLAQSFDYSFSATSDPTQAAKFKVNQWGFYAGDQWRMLPKMTVTYGVRVDAPQYPDKPSTNPLAQSLFGFATDVVPNDVQWSPRVGVNYDVRGDGREQIRGGVGMFTGRPAYVWISNQFANTGIDFTRIGASFNTNNRIPFVTDPLNQPRTVTGASAGSFANEIDLIDPNFNYPSILRGNIGYDRELFLGFLGTAEFVWSKTLDDIKYQNLNFAPSPTVRGVGGRPFFIRQVTTLSDVVLLQNTNEGYNWNLSYQVRRPLRNGLYLDGSYSYGVSKTIMDGTSDQAASNWGNVYIPGDPNNPPLSRSNFDPGHRVNLTMAYDIPMWRSFKTTVSMFYSGQSGRPYTLTYNRDVNGDNRGTNDLLYIPGSASELTFTGGTYEQFAQFINADSCLSDYVGRIIERNACRAPWQNTLDARVNVQLPFKRVRTEITADVLNLINLFDSKQGQFQYASFGQIQVFQPVPTSVTATAPLTGYNISTLTSPTFTKFFRDDLRSRWQLQLGARLRF